MYADFQENGTFQGKFSILYLKNIQEEKLMITGNMILIENKKIYMSIPFCGDMEPEANGRFAYYLLQHLDSKGELKNAVTKFDSLKYDYAKRGFNTRILEELEELEVLDLESNDYILRLQKNNHSLCSHLQNNHRQSKRSLFPPKSLQVRKFSHCKNHR